MTTQHTPGPWTVEDTNSLRVHIRSEAVATAPGTPENLRAYYQSIASATQRDPHPVYGAGIPAKTCLANARLIASAPDLLAALRKAETWVATFSDQVDNPTGPLANDLAEIRAAIARATA